MGGKEKEGRMGGRGKGKGGERGENVEGPGKWSAPGPVLALGGPANVNDGCPFLCCYKTCIHP